MTKDIGRIKQKVTKILKEHGVKKAGIFGSYARGEQNKNSDIDILIEFDGGLLGLIRLEREISEEVGKKVDILTYRSINHLLRKRILKEEIKII